jgi:hypothetical protein
MKVMTSSIEEIFVDRTLTLEQVREKWINNPISLTTPSVQFTAPSFAKVNWKLDFLQQ